MYDKLQLWPRSTLLGVEATKVLQVLLADRVETVGYPELLSGAEGEEGAAREERQPDLEGRQKQFDRILEYIEDNYSRYDLTLDEVAEYAGLSGG